MALKLELENFGMLLARSIAAVITLTCILWNADVPGMFGVAFLNEQYLSLILGLSLAAAFLTTRFSGAKDNRPPIWDIAIALTGLATLLYTCFNYVDLLNQIGDRPLVLTIIGTVVVVLVMEGLRRATGWVLFCIIGIFIVYALLAHMVPGPLIGANVKLPHLMQYIGFDPSAVFGTPLNVGATIVILFVFMGKLLFKAGGGDFFTDLALAAMGKTRGGSAKISIIASALFGSISGSAVSNVATTGVITIPLMRKGGYSAVNAGAIEAIASTGGQLMPPIMGAAAFLMAEFLEIPYTEVMLAAIIPALLYYASTFIQVDLLAARDNISNVDDTLPTTLEVLKKGWQFILPFVALLYALFALNSEPQVAALYASLAVVVTALVRPYGDVKFGWRELVDTFWETGISTTDLIMIVAAAGFVIGILNITGLGFALTLFLVQMAGNSLVIILIVAAVVCVFLGMGMPTSGVYVLLAALVAPAIVETGVNPLAAHMFILYFGMMSMITPPIALAAFAATALSKASPMATGFAAMRLGWVAYVVPFLFVVSPALLWSGDNFTIAMETAKALVGVYFISVAIVGYFTRSLNVMTRLILIIMGALAMTAQGLFPYATTASLLAIACGIAFLFFIRSNTSANSKQEAL